MKRILIQNTIKPPPHPQKKYLICGLALCIGLLACKRETVEREAQTLMVLNPTIEKVQGQEQQGEDNTFSDGVTWSIGMIIDRYISLYPRSNETLLG